MNIIAKTSSFFIFELKRKSTKIYFAEVNGLPLQLRLLVIRPDYTNPVTFVYYWGENFYKGNSAVTYILQ